MSENKIWWLDSFEENEGKVRYVLKNKEGGEMRGISSRKAEDVKREINNTLQRMNCNRGSVS